MMVIIKSNVLFSTQLANFEISKGFPYILKSGLLEKTPLYQTITNNRLQKEQNGESVHNCMAHGKICHHYSEILFL